VVFGARLLAGAKVAVVPVYDTVPDTNNVPCIKVKEQVVMVEGSIASLKVAVIFWLKGTLVALFTGFVELTAGVEVTIGEVIPILCSQPAMTMASSSGINHILERFFPTFMDSLLFQLLKIFP
jgi:hypothetical protein